MGFAPVYYVATMTTNTSQTSSLDLGNSFYTIWVEVPTMATSYGQTSTPLFLQVSADNVTFRRMTSAEGNTFPVGTNDFTIASSVSQRMVPVTGFGFRYVKVEASATVTGAVAHPMFKFVGSGNA
jgi:hypothetical protein